MPGHAMSTAPSAERCVRRAVGWPMLLGHALAVLATAWLLAHGERGCGGVADRILPYAGAAPAGSVDPDPSSSPPTPRSSFLSAGRSPVPAPRRSPDPTSSRSAPARAGPCRCRRGTCSRTPLGRRQICAKRTPHHDSPHPPPSSAAPTSARPGRTGHRRTRPATCRHRLGSCPGHSRQPHQRSVQRADLPGAQRVGDRRHREAHRHAARRTPLSCTSAPSPSPVGPRPPARPSWPSRSSRTAPPSPRRSARSPGRPTRGRRSGPASTRSSPSPSDRCPSRARSCCRPSRPTATARWSGWDQPTPASGEEPEHPAPVLEIVVATPDSPRHHLGRDARRRQATRWSRRRAPRPVARALAGLGLAAGLGALVFAFLTWRRGSGPTPGS